MMIYYITINIIAFLFMGIDKYKAVHKHNRISEKALLEFIWFGGALGSSLGMFIFHHKIRKKIFIFSVFLSFIVHFLLLFSLTL